MLELSSTETSVGVRQLERPQEVVCLLEVGADGEDLVNQVLHADNAVLAKAVLDELVVGKSNTLLIDLSISALVDELSHGLEVGVAVGNIRVDDRQHLLGSLGQLDENTIIDLEESKKLKDFSRFGSNLVDTDAS